MVLSMDRWSGKVAIVTGADSGIGAAIAEALVENGLLVVGVDLRSDLVKSLTFHPFQADVSKEEDILKLFEWTTENLGPVHVLINAAGKAPLGYLTDGKTEAWKEAFDLNVLGLCIATREAVKIMRANDISGHIIHMNSIAGHLVPNIDLEWNVYPASKFAVTALTETLRQELNGLGLKIKITSVSPGLVETESTTLGDYLPLDMKDTLKEMPVLKPKDVADGVVYVLSTPEHVQVQELIIKPVGEI